MVIGEGEGKNWWCVVFPQLGMGEEFVETASLSGELSETLTGEYEIRFWLLEKLGQVKNHFFTPSE